MAEAWNAERARSLIAHHRGRQDQLLVVLQTLQETFGRVPDDAMALVADVLNLSRAEVHGVRTFYHDFHEAPRGRHVLKICRAESCQAMGGERLVEHAARKAGIALGETAADGSLTLEAVYCLGLCACSPAALYDDQPLGRLTEAALTSLIADARS